MHALSLKGNGSAVATLSLYLIWAVMTVGMMIGATASATTIFQENFAGGLGGFTATGSVTTGTFGARLRGGSTSGAQITSGAISTTGFTNVTLSFDRTTSGLDLGETAVASYSTDGSTFTQLESVRTATGRVTLSLGAAANQSRVFIRFATNASSLLETYTVANIVLDGTGGSDPGGGGVLPPVSSIETDGPFATTIDMNVGSGGSGWVVRPTTLGQNGLRHPVFVWGPGAGATPGSYQFHLRRLASHGFVVYSEVSTSSGSEMRAALDWLVSENGRSGSAYYQRLALDRMAAGGHSRGSIGTFAIASDARLKTTIHVAGGSFDGNGSRNLRNPAIYICGKNDTTATPNCQRDYNATTVPIVYTVMDNVGHIEAARVGLPAITAWLRWHIGGETQRRSMFVGAGCYFCSGIWSMQTKNWSNATTANQPDSRPLGSGMATERKYAALLDQLPEATATRLQKQLDARDSARPTDYAKLAKHEREISLLLSTEQYSLYEQLRESAAIQAHVQRFSEHIASTTPLHPTQQRALLLAQLKHAPAIDALMLASELEREDITPMERAYIRDVVEQGIEHHCRAFLEEVRADLTPEQWSTLASFERYLVVPATE